MQNKQIFQDSLLHVRELLESCISSKSLIQGKIIHQYLLKFYDTNYNTHSLVLDKLTRLYISCKRPQLAHRVFNSIPSRERKKKTILWNQMIRGYAWDGPFEKAVDLYNEMVDSGVTPTKYTYPFVLKACSALQDIETGVKIHGQVRRLNLDNDLYVRTALVDFYVKCGCLVEAREVFDGMPERDIVAWNAMVTGFSLYGMWWSAIGLVLEMQQKGVEPNSTTILSIMPVIGEAGRLREGKTVHGFCLRRCFNDDVVVGTGLVDMYGKCGQLVYAKKIFAAMGLKNEVTWSAMVGACVICNSTREGMELFGRMRMEVGESPSPVMLATIIRGCAKLNDLSMGRQLHCNTIKLGFNFELMVANTVLSMYAKCGSINDAVRFFEEMHVKDSVSYSAIISGSVQNGYAEEALQLFHKMQLVGIVPEMATMMGFLPACSYLAALQHGICGHGYSVMRGFTADVSICNALIDMYSKCGKVDAARQVFDKMYKKDVVSWNAMIVGYGIHGLGKEAILLFHEMQNVGHKPDEVTFIALLSACSHSGLVTQGKHLFLVMSQEFDIVPKMDHYFCMVDLLGRAGLLDEAYKLISMMPYEPDAHLWNALLAACRIHKNIELGEEVSHKIQTLGPASTGNFVLLFNLYTTAQRWDDAANLRIQQKELGFKKKPGCSWIEVHGIVHAFVGGDWSHQQSPEIYMKLEELVAEMKRLGYTAEADFVYHDVEEEEKEKILLYHSEKLAVAYGIISLQADKPILVTKNLRVCGDCHTALKYITIIAKREITVRDTSRFHHFRNGICSCGDFW
ncbi:pentatricopeptide repeat-containing protein At3g16610 [Sesamum indicum]|uniref:Pentatricopeptide repeat-containing protein At3g16610 n=1 Tax=Sesamum indicum TaxID=4182 RepID=A0A6I9UAS6_SESIN|nr:pentatricopeptide repeat-containing protein At3g16610 [Sesamum indicum]XP_011098057.1 pentatricopeptide repeat-containing protein At3g16610 [Sesamum indicum]XP_020554383.1 pentatricopeptide repeat-containing protein At3g16610 [Sesamum indicum]XP_020554384.1 pentatricopeptide repeat-containing protein At3g16610 [Sesamum indicum]